MQLDNNFSSKVLLFGEYAIILGAKGMAIPFDKYSGYFSLAAEKNQYQNELLEFYEYLSNLEVIASELDLDRFKSDIENNLVFNSNIPKGSGVGSSGAICAAIYQRYLKTQKLGKLSNNNDLKHLIDRMALMESFYHGSSSGLDPLVSLANKTLLVENRNKLSEIQKPESLKNFLIFNTGITRKTAPLVHLFLEKMRQPEFENSMHQFIELNNSAIQACMSNDQDQLSSLMYQISKWQYLNLSEMIVDSVKEVWLEGIESKEYFIKLCGAGGGGHYIVYDAAMKLKGKLSNFNTLSLM